MNEENPNERIQQRLNAAIQAAKNPINYLERAKSVPGINPLTTLIELRHIIKNTPGLQIENPDVTFAAFYRADNGEAAFYVALTTMLQGAGYARDEVERMAFVFLTREAVPGKEAMVETVAALFTEALTTVYGIKGARLH